MDVSLLDMAMTALGIMAEPHRLLILASGVMVGLMLGVIPGLGGIIGMALLMPFTFSMDPYSAFAFLIGMGSVTTTSDTIPAVLFGVPGTTGSAATVLDGYPLAKQGQAGRAFGAAYSASLLGGLAGALLLAVSIPILRPVILFLGSPELLAISIFGLSMVATLSGSSPLKGLSVAGLGLLAAMVGSDPILGVQRWTFETLYLWDGIPLIPVTLGLFALPELVDMAITKSSIAGDSKEDVRKGQWEGVRDTFRHKWLVLRCSWLGAALGAVPGLGAAVIDWIAYGHAARTEKNTETFGHGDIRGVIASESSNNAKEGGALVPTIAFGVPGSASMAILLGAFMMHGLIPGPEMLTTKLDITYSIVWSVALANILGTGICLAFSNQLAKVALIRMGILLPLVLSIVFIGAFQGSRQWGDLYILLGFGVFGWIMKRMGWPRPPLILGFVLGEIIERYFYISYSRYEWDWLTRPFVVVMFALALLGLTRPLIRNLKKTMASKGAILASRPRLTPSIVFSLCIAFLLALTLYTSSEWEFQARLVPRVVGVAALVCVAISLVYELFLDPEKLAAAGQAHAEGEPDSTSSAKMDAVAAMELRVVLRRAGIFFASALGFLLLTKVIGLLPGILIFVILWARLAGQETLRMSLVTGISLTGFCWFLFDQLLSIPWPRALLGDWSPALRVAFPYL